MEFRRPRTALTATIAAVALAAVALSAAGCGSARPELAGSWATPASPAPSSPPSASQAASPTPPPSASPSAKAKSPTPSPTKARNAKYVFPVGGKPFSYARTHHDYPATDIIAPCGLPVRAATSGVVLEANRVDKYDAATNDGAERGGLFVSILGDDGVRYYGSHLSAVSAGIGPGVRVGAGQQVGKVGDTGDASACHLHFGISPPCAKTGDWWVRRGVIWPYTFFDAWRAGTNRSPVSTVAAWKAQHGCPRTAP
jgi:murein DD-endopeptidase MepM/ murein hydrolase activator NlpD